MLILVPMSVSCCIALRGYLQPNVVPDSRLRGNSIACGDVVVTVGNDGSVTGLAVAGVEWASAASSLFALTYTTYNRKESWVRQLKSLPFSRIAKRSATAHAPSDSPYSATMRVGCRLVRAIQ